MLDCVCAARLEGSGGRERAEIKLHIQAANMRTVDVPDDISRNFSTSIILSKG